jgi:hypothetical protein
MKSSPGRIGAAGSSPGRTLVRLRWGPAEGWWRGLGATLGPPSTMLRMVPLPTSGEDI